MIDYETALKIVRDEAAKHTLETEEIPFTDVAGRFCAADIHAPFSLQPFDNSAMDGFAVNMDIGKTGETRLEITGTIAAGDVKPPAALDPGQCVEVMTGAPVPVGANAVIPVEKACIEGGRLVVRDPPGVNDNIRFAGQDVETGGMVIPAGQRMTDGHIMTLASLGLGRVRVRQKPRVTLLTTGLEIIDDLNAPLAPGQIYNSNGPYAEAVLAAFSTDCRRVRTNADDPEVFSAFLADEMRRGTRIIVSTGAVSAGKFDFIRGCLERAGAEILFHKVAARPGKPVLFARLPDGAVYFGLPGNPAAVAASLRFLVWPYLRALGGAAAEEPLYALLDGDFKKKAGMGFFLKSRIYGRADGMLQAEILKGQQSFMVVPFTRMNAWIHAPAESAGLAQGDIVAVYPRLPA